MEENKDNLKNETVIKKCDKHEIVWVKKWLGIYPFFQKGVCKKCGKQAQKKIVGGIEYVEVSE